MLSMSQLLMTDDWYLSSLSGMPPDLLDFELVDLQGADEMLLAGGRIAREQQHARAAQRHGVLEARLAETLGGRSCRPARSRRPS